MPAVNVLGKQLFANKEIRTAQQLCPSFWKLSVSSALPMLRVCPIPLECSLPIFILSLPVRRPLPFLPLRSPSAALQSLLYSQLLS